MYFFIALQGTLEKFEVIYVMGQLRPKYILCEYVEMFQNRIPFFFYIFTHSAQLLLAQTTFQISHDLFTIQKNISLQYIADFMVI